MEIDAVFVLVLLALLLEAILADFQHPHRSGRLIRVYGATRYHWEPAHDPFANWIDLVATDQCAEREVSAMPYPIRNCPSNSIEKNGCSDSAQLRPRAIDYWKQSPHV